jgi:hypothetical protein
LCLELQEVLKAGLGFDWRSSHWQIIALMGKCF